MTVVELPREGLTALSARDRASAALRES